MVAIEGMTEFAGRQLFNNPGNLEIGLQVMAVTYFLMIIPAAADTKPL
jgi:hypothetical protein